MRREISPEMYNYNKFPGPQFISFEDHVKSDAIEFLILKNVKDAFDATVFSQRFSDILLKYDYIVGDWGNEQLRLKGFYKQTDKKLSAMNINRLDDYITEYCNFGCAYFVLENPSPKSPRQEEEASKSHRRRDHRKRRRPRKKEVDFSSYYQDKGKSKKSYQDTPPKQNFVIRKKEH